MKNKNLYIITCFLVLTTSFLTAMKREQSQLKIPTETTSQEEVGQVTSFLADRYNAWFKIAALERDFAYLKQSLADNFFRKSITDKTLDKVLCDYNAQLNPTSPVKQMVLLSLNRMLFHPDLKQRITVLAKKYDYVFDFVCNSSAKKKEQNLQTIKRVEKLFDAIESNNIKKMQKMLKQQHENLDAGVINQAFNKAMLQEKNFGLNTALEFFKIPEIKKMLSAQTLDFAITQSIWDELDDLFFKIIDDKILRKKVYTDDKTRKHFELALKYSLTHDEFFLETILSYHDLKEKMKHLDWIPKDMLKASSRQSQEPAQQETFQEDSLNPEEEDNEEEEDNFEEGFNVPFSHDLKPDYSEHLNPVLLTPLQSQAANTQEDDLDEQLQNLSFSLLGHIQFQPLDEEEITKPQFCFDENVDLEKEIDLFLAFVQKLNFERLKQFLAEEDKNNSLLIISGAPFVKALERLEQHLADNDNTIKQRVCLILDELEKYDALKETIKAYCRNKSTSDPNSRLIRLVQERGREQNTSNQK